ncbi:hypothetical protein HMPREF1002_00806 [Porphyromonas sp. 31_2]|nr:hypothetical protein HMPREF1002_00806 [Porphyromonas sp. 31_2]
MSESVTLKSYFYEVLIPSSQKNTSSPIEDILHHVSISFMKKLALYKCFNPRTHTGCDYRNAIENGASEVSIHAPTRGATIFDLRKFISVQTFQSTHPHGVRLRRNHPRTISTKFQSTHPHGVRRRAATPTFYDIRGFQSTHPHGVRRVLFLNKWLCLLVSIHAPTRGATYRHLRRQRGDPVSIHAPTRGATCRINDKN